MRCSPERHLSRKKMYSLWDVRKRDFFVMFPQLHVNYWTSGMAFLQALGHFRASGNRDTNAYHLIPQNLIDPVSHPPLSQFLILFLFLSLSLSSAAFHWVYPNRVKEILWELIKQLKANYIYFFTSHACFLRQCTKSNLIRYSYISLIMFQ